jgi:Holliday junction resolvase
MTTQRESRISGDIMDALRAEGVFCFKIQGGPTMMVGLPDIIACVDGMFLGLETKVPEKRSNVSVRQKYVHGLIRAAGGRVEVVCGVQEALGIIDSMRHAPTITSVPEPRRGPRIND